MLSNKPLPYSFSFVGGKTYAYTFIADAEASYAIRFKPTPYLFPADPDLSANIYEMVIDLVDAPTKRSMLDPRIGATVVAICGDFLR